MTFWTLWAHDTDWELPIKDVVVPYLKKKKIAGWITKAGIPCEGEKGESFHCWMKRVYTTIYLHGIWEKLFRINNV